MEFDLALESYLLIKIWIVLHQIVNAVFSLDLVEAEFSWTSSDVYIVFYSVIV